MIDLISSALAHRPSIEHTLMESAKLWARRSTCSRSEVGVVLASEDNRILATGYNGAPKGLRHCDHECTCAYDPNYQPDVTTTRKNHMPTCPSIKPCLVAVHGEANAIAWAARNGIRTDGAKLFTTLAPCYACSQLIINAGIGEVYYLMDYRLADGLALLDAAGVDVVRYTHDR